MLLAFKDKDAREPVAVFYPSPASQLAADDALNAWLHAHRFPSSFELSKDVFQQVMYAPHKPLVLIVATPPSQRTAVSDKLHEIAQKWRLHTRRTDATPASAPMRDVVFTWMDAGQWGKWMKDMYGIKAGTEPEIVVADHEVSTLALVTFRQTDSPWCGVVWCCSVCCTTTRTVPDTPSR